MPQRRRSIHKKEEDNHTGDREKVHIYQCGQCEKIFLLKNDEEQRINDEELSEWENTERVYPDLRTGLPYTCKACKGRVPESARRPKESTNIKNNSGKNVLSLNSILLAFAVLAVFAGIVFVTLTDRGEEPLKETPFDVIIPRQSQREKLLDEDIYKLEDTYTRQEERVWYTLLAGIKSVVRENPNQPSVFLMLYDSDIAGNTARCIAKDVIKAASKYLMGYQEEALVYSGRSLERRELLDDPGKLLIYLNRTVRERGSLVITELQDVPPKVAKSFHFICDKYSPLVERAVLFFTLSVRAVGPRIQKDAEARLNELWAKDMEDNFLNPLITRMTPNILKITSDNYNC